MTYTTLIKPEELDTLLQPTGPQNIVVFDTRFSLGDTSHGQRAYHQSHIAGAWYLHLDRDLSSPIGLHTGRHPLPDVALFTQTMRSHGVAPDTQVIAYDDAGGMFASRLWWLLKWLSHEAVAVLDGGWQAWQEFGGAVTSHTPTLPQAGAFIANPRPEMLLSAQEVEQGLASGTIVLCDARAPERFRGDVEPIDKVAGHVPGAINLPFAHNLTEAGRFKPADQLRQLHTLNSVSTPSRESERAENPERAANIVHMCGSGVTACHNLLAAAAAGLPIPQLYAGSWSQWITDPNRPVAKGQ